MVSTRARGEMSHVCRGLDSCPRTQNRLRKRVVIHSIVRKLSSRDGKLSQVTGLFFETWLSRGGSGLWTFFGVICKPSPCAGSASKNLRCHPLRTTCLSARMVHNDLCLWRLRFSKRVFVPETETKLRNERDIGNGPPQLT